MHIIEFSLTVRLYVRLGHLCLQSNLRYFLALLMEELSEIESFWQRKFKAIKLMVLILDGNLGKPQKK